MPIPQAVASEAGAADSSASDEKVNLPYGITQSDIFESQSANTADATSEQSSAPSSAQAISESTGSNTLSLLSSNPTPPQESDK